MYKVKIQKRNYNTYFKFKCKSFSHDVLMELKKKKIERKRWLMLDIFVAGMRILVMLLLDTLPMLGNVLLLCFFVFFIFGIVGVQLWQGILRQRCYLPKGINLTLPE